MAEQNYSNHVRVDRAYLALMVLNLTLIVAAIRYGGLHFHALNWILLGLAVAVTCATMATRMYGLRNQDRIIRLEETIRLQGLHAASTGLTTRQIIALRFASDEEVAALAEQAGREQLTPKQIKQAVRNWRADFHRI